MGGTTTSSLPAFFPDFTTGPSATASTILETLGGLNGGATTLSAPGDEAVDDCAGLRVTVEDRSRPFARTGSLTIGTGKVFLRELVLGMAGSPDAIVGVMALSELSGGRNPDPRLEDPDEASSVVADTPEVLRLDWGELGKTVDPVSS